MGTVVQTEAEIDRLMDTDRPDPEAAAGYRTRDVRRRRSGGAGAPPSRPHRACALQGRARAVMAAALAADRSFLDAVVAGVFTVPGDGCVDFPAVLAALPGYDGWLVVEAEQDPAKAQPLIHARRGYANLARDAERAGLQ